MAYRTLELTLISAKDLKDINLFGKMDVYAVVSIEGDHRSAQRTRTDVDGGKNPSWNSTLRFSVPADPSYAAGVVLHVVLRAERALGDKDVGEVHIPLKEILDPKASSFAQFISYQVRKPSSGKAKGVLNVSYKFIDTATAVAPHAPAPAPAPAPEKYAAHPPPQAAAYPVYPPPAWGSPPTGYPAPAASASASGSKPVKTEKHDEPVTAYPAAASPYPAAGSSYPYPPPGGYPPPYQQQPYGYAPPPPGYGYPPPPQAGYGYPPPPASGYAYAQPPKKNKLGGGAGLGLGLLGGALGGLLIGDMIGDASENAYDAGYDDGFDGGF